MEPLRALAHSDDTTAARAARESLDSINDRIRSYNIENDREEDSNVILWPEMVSFFQTAKELESSIAMSSASSDHAAVAGMRGQVQRLAQAYDAFLSSHRYPSSWATHVSPMPSPSSSQAQTQAPSDASMSDVLSDNPARAGLRPGSRPGFRISANRHGADHVVEDGVQISIKAWKKQGYGYQFLLQMPQENEDDVPCYELVKTSTFGPAACTSYRSLQSAVDFSTLQQGVKYIRAHCAEEFQIGGVASVRREPARRHETSPRFWGKQPITYVFGVFGESEEPWWFTRTDLGRVLGLPQIDDLIDQVRDENSQGRPPGLPSEARSYGSDSGQQTPAPRDASSTPREPPAKRPAQSAMPPPSRTSMPGLQSTFGAVPLTPEATPAPFGAPVPSGKTAPAGDGRMEQRMEQRMTRIEESASQTSRQMESLMAMMRQLMQSTNK
ncbi:hypothetical protein LTR04_002631 [Oleoguttula sp. CCFEE 6159]|nr:hypothetical protein LTR04_002631 [Oleoguttula sp. CCFEE 6159]